jgi:hypothetical protein
MIVQALRDEGADLCSVVSLSGEAHGVPDLLVGLGYRTYLVEVKDGENQPPSKQRLTPDQERFIRNWKGYPVVVLRDVPSAKAWARRMLGGSLDD